MRSLRDTRQERGQLALPASGNLTAADGSPLTAVLVQHPADGIEDGHEVAFQKEAPQHQYRCFLWSLLRGTPRVAAGGRLPIPASEVTLDAPQLFTFDIFGTVVDWKTGLEEACRAHGRPLHAGEIDRVVDAQGELEQSGQYDLYTSIVLKSLCSVLGLDATSAAAIAGTAGRWPLFPDAREGLRRLRAIAPCVAITNSDRHHGAQVRAQLGFDLDGWVCAEEVRHYKPKRELWDAVAEGRSILFGPHWWHVSAYADYDLKTAEALSLTRVLVKRPHFRPGPSDVEVNDLLELAERAALLVVSR